MDMDFPVDPRLKNVDNELVEAVFQEFKRNVDLVGIHLRDARNMAFGVRETGDDRVLRKAAIILSAAALESNLVYLSGVALRLAEKRVDTLAPPQLRYLKGVVETIDENGKVVETPARQSLRERLKIVPSLLARTILRSYELNTRSAWFTKLRRTIERRDAIVHPRWDSYVS